MVVLVAVRSMLVPDGCEVRARWSLDGDVLSVDVDAVPVVDDAQLSCALAYPCPSRG